MLPIKLASNICRRSPKFVLSKVKNQILSVSNSSYVFTCKHLATSPPSQKPALEDLHLSESCIKRLKEISDGVNNLRVLVEGGGCSGFKYHFQWDSTIAEDDIIIEKDGVKVVVDKTSFDFVKGSTVDFYHELIRSTFRILNNPKAEQGCSCGSSFSVKL